MRFRAPIIAAVFLGLAIALVWLRREDPANAVAESVAVPPAAAPTVAAGGDGPVNEAASPRFPPPPHEPAAGAVLELPRSPLPGEALSTPLIQLIEDQRAFNRPSPPTGLEQFPGVQPQLAESERAFGAEPIDASWARNAEADALGKIAQVEGLELVHLRVECRTTMCRLEMAQSGGGPGTTPFTDVIEAIGLQPHWMISLAGRGSGSLNTVAYLWRDGFAPPRPGAAEEAPDGDEARLSEPVP